MLKQVIHFGLPSGVQNSIIAFANVIVQSNINAFGSNAMAGCGTYAKLEGFAFLPITCFTMALTTFVSQNLGAHQYDRVKKGVRFGIVCSTTLAECIGVVLFLLAEPLVAIFQNDPAVIEIGVRQAHVEALFFCFLAFAHCIAGIMRARASRRCRCSSCLPSGVCCAWPISPSSCRLWPKSTSSSRPIRSPGA